MHREEWSRWQPLKELAPHYYVDTLHDGIEWTFFKTEKSEYIKWLSEQSYEFSDGISPIHFCLIALDSVIDVVASYEPTVEILK